MSKHLTLCVHFISINVWMDFFFFSKSTDKSKKKNKTDGNTLIMDVTDSLHSSSYWPRYMWGPVLVLPLLYQSPEYPAGPHTTPPTLHHTTAPRQGGTAGAGVATRQSSRQSVTTHRYTATQFTLDLNGGGMETQRKIMEREQSSHTLDDWQRHQNHAIIFCTALQLVVLLCVDMQR